MSTDVTAYLDEAIASNKVFVAAKSYCPHSKKTKELLKSLEVDAKIIDLDLMDNGEAIQQALLDRTGQKTVPNVFINSQHIGGNSDLAALHEKGELKKLLA